MIKKIDPNRIKECLDNARKSPRKRSHFNLHDQLEDPVQRLCIALTEGTYVRPHQHPASNKWELLLAIQGTSILVIFDSKGEIIEHFEISPSGSMSAIEMPPNTWHTLFPAGKESVVMEIKEGPYTPAQPEHFASWAPEEGSAETSDFLNKIRKSIHL